MTPAALERFFRIALAALKLALRYACVTSRCATVTEPAWSVAAAELQRRRDPCARRAAWLVELAACAWSRACRVRSPGSDVLIASSVCAVLLFAVFVLPRAVSAELPSVRVITLRVAADDQYRALPDWETRLRSVVQKVSATWITAFNVRWEISSIVPWQSPADLRLGPRGTSIEDLAASISRGSEDVLVLVSGRRCVGRWRGEAMPFADLVAIQLHCPGLTGPQPASERIVSHEFAHLFGAFHVMTNVSIMNSRATSDEFDSQTTRVIRLMRSHKFAAGIDEVDGAMRQEWTAIFLEGHAGDEINLIAKALRNRGSALGRAKKGEEARALFEEAVRIEPQFATAHLDLGNIASQQKRSDDAIASYRRAIAIDPSYASAHEALGIELAQRERFDESLAALRTAVALEPTKASMRASLGYALLSQGKLLDAVGELRTAVRLESDSAYARRLLGDALIRQGQAADAETHLRQAVRLQPDSGNSHILLGTALGMQKKLDEAVPVLQAAVRLEPSSALAHGNLGYTHALLGDWRSAVAEYREALRLDPRHVATRINLAMAHWQERRLDEAAAEFRRVLELAPGADGVRVNLGRVLMLQMKLDAAIATFNEVLTRNPRAGEAHFYIAQAHAASGRYVAAWQSVGNAEALGAPVPQPFIDELTRKMPRPIAPLR